MVAGSRDDSIDLLTLFVDGIAKIHKTQRDQLVESLKRDNGKDRGCCEEWKPSPSEVK